ncbi:MAG: tetratricopeptide repeat protein, partial [candidate division NC10 bacterium]
AISPPPPPPAAPLPPDFGPANPRSAPRSVQLGETALREGRPATAEAELRRALAAAPLQTEPRMTLARLLESEGRGAEARIGRGGAAPTPIRAQRAEMVLRGEAPSDAAVRAAAEAAAREAEPLSDLMGSADYRREMIRVWVRRLLVALRDGTPRASPNRG